MSAAGLSSRSWLGGARRRDRCHRTVTRLVTRHMALFTSTSSPPSAPAPLQVGFLLSNQDSVPHTEASEVEASCSRLLDSGCLHSDVLTGPLVHVPPSPP